MRKLMVMTVVVMGMAVGYTTAEAKDTPTPNAMTPQAKQGPTDAEIDEAHRMNREYDAAKAARAQGIQGATDAEIDEAHRMNREFDAAKAAKQHAVMGKVESVSGDVLTIRIPDKSNRKMDRLKANTQSKIMKDAHPSTLAALKEGDEVRVSYKIVGSERQLVNVDATSPKAPAPAKK
ncbi:MAG: hypothetical protein ABW123_08400 [Cystobacter sp.]